MVETGLSSINRGFGQKNTNWGGLWPTWNYQGRHQMGRSRFKENNISGIKKPIIRLQQHLAWNESGSWTPTFIQWAIDMYRRQQQEQLVQIGWNSHRSLAWGLTHWKVCAISLFGQTWALPEPAQAYGPVSFLRGVHRPDIDHGELWHVLTGWVVLRCICVQYPQLQFMSYQQFTKGDAHPSSCLVWGGD